MNFIKAISLLIGLLTVVAGCSITKLGDVPQTRENYNKAMDSSENEQFLLNIVRMHYGHSPYFVAVDSITTQSTLRTKLEGQFFTSRNAVMPGPFWNISPTIEFTEAPTITYSPLQGSKYVSGMMTPLTVSRIGMLQASGWDLATVLKLTINRIGALDNGEVSRHVVDGGGVPENKEFIQFIQLITDLAQNNQITSSITSYNGELAILVSVATPEIGHKLSQLLHLQKSYTQLIFSPKAINIPGTPENIIYLQTRSFLGIMNYLAQKVQDADDTLTPPLKGDFNVMITLKEPKNTVIKVDYNGVWYSIANNDVSSKAVMVLLKLIYSLQMGDIKVNLPVVTIPVR